MKRTKLAITLGLATFLSSVGAIAQDKMNIAYFASSAQNGYNQSVYSGIQAKATKLGVDVAIFDGQFDAALQYSQIEDVLTSGRFDGYILMANDTVGIAGAVEQITQKNQPVATVLFPIGPDLNSLKPQVQGLTASYIYPPADGAKAQAESVVEFCKDIAPCKVAILVGFKAAPFDNLRLEVFKEVLSAHDNIQIVAEAEGMYSPDVSLTAMQDIMQSHPDLNVILSTADQQLIGAELAVMASGVNISKLFLSGAGATEIGIEAVKEGRWDNTYLHLPNTMGELALEAVVASLRNEPFEAEVNMEEKTDMPALITAEDLANNPDFEAQWAQ